MLRAHQEALIQQANFNVIKMRNKELGYYTNYLSLFATQMALLTGFASVSITDKVLLIYPKSPLLCHIYWFAVSLCLAASFHCILSVCCVNVYGTGMALRGPAGSLVNALEGFIIEKDPISLSFFIAVCTFATCCTSYFWLIMPMESACASTFIMIVGAFITSWNCSKIYNRFLYDEPVVDWTDMKLQLNQREKNVDDTTPLLRYIKTGNTASTDTVWESGFSNSIQDNGSSRTKALFHEGYMSKKDTNDDFFSGFWQRCYFVLLDSSLYLYKSKRDFDFSPKDLVCRRPIQLAGYRLFTKRKDGVGYFLTLRPEDPHDDRREWEFKCDTLDEFNDWSSAIHQGILQAETNPAETTPFYKIE